MAAPRQSSGSAQTAKTGQSTALVVKVSRSRMHVIVVVYEVLQYQYLFLCPTQLNLFHLTVSSHSRKPSASRGETAKYKNNNREIIPEQNLARDGGFDNPVYESASQDDRSTSFTSPPQVSVSPPRPSVINQLRA